MKTEVKIPKPLANFVLVKNPVFKLEESMAGELAKLAPAEKEEYMKHNMFDVWQDLEVIAVGPSMATIAVGDRVITTVALSASGIIVMKGEYIMIRESNFVGIW
tara:strand:- start:10246 stop:10557 length:312 start_codon:yes stop_codon:yes gene_type:complete